MGKHKTEKRFEDAKDVLLAIHRFIETQFPEIVDIDITPVVQFINKMASDRGLNNHQATALVGRILISGASYWLEERFKIDTKPSGTSKCTRCGTPIFAVGVYDFIKKEGELCVDCAEKGL